MHITILALGSRGDVQPTIALGKGLQAAGHSVTLVAGSDFQAWVESHGLTYGRLDVDTREIMQGEGGMMMVQSESKPSKMAQAMRAILATHGDALIDAVLTHCVNADVVISGLLTDPLIQPLARHRQVRHISALLQPYRATPVGQANANPLLPKRTSPLNTPIAPLMLGGLTMMVFKPIVDRLAARLGVGKQRLLPTLRYVNSVPTLIAASPHVVPPEGFAPHVRVTGYWFLDEHSGWQPPDTLVRFIEAGDAPIYIGFGSMTFPDPQAILQTIVKAVDRTGCRVILYKGTMGDVGRLPSGIHLLDGAPHTWLFPRVRAVVHHGGAGTTAAALRARRPTLVVPFLGDQPYWARRVHEIGAGPPPIDYLSLTPENLSTALEALLNWPDVPPLITEEGVQVAVAAVEEFGA